MNIWTKCMSREWITDAKQQPLQCFRNFAVAAVDGNYQNYHPNFCFVLYNHLSFVLKSTKSFYQVQVLQLPYMCNSACQGNWAVMEYNLGHHIFFWLVLCALSFTRFLCFAASYIRERIWAIHRSSFHKGKWCECHKCKLCSMHLLFIFFIVRIRTENRIKWNAQHKQSKSMFVHQKQENQMSFGKSFLSSNDVQFKRKSDWIESIHHKWHKYPRAQTVPQSNS